MNKIKIISDSSCDLSAEQVKESDIKIVPFYILLENQHLKEGVDIQVRDFYQKLVDNPNIFPKTACPSPQDYIDVFEKYINQNQTVICFSISEKLSGSHSSAQTAKQMCLEKYPDAKIEIIDSETLSLNQGQLVLEACRLRDAGASADEIVSSINKIKKTGRTFFTIHNLDYLSKGGRIGKLAGIASKLIKINPLIVVSDGDISSGGLALGRKMALKKVREVLKEYLTKNKLAAENCLFALGFGYDKDEISDFKSSVLSEFSLDEKQLPVRQIGATVAVHTGPTPLGLVILPKLPAGV